MPLQVEAEPFVTSLRERLSLKLENHMNVPDVLAAFDRATVEAVFAAHNGSKPELTPQQRAGLTKRRNNALKRAQAAEEKNAQNAHRDDAAKERAE